MAIVLEYDKRHIDPATATVLLRRGDDWRLSAQIVDRFARYRDDVDLTGAQATAYFEAEDGSASGFPCTVANAEAGKLELHVPASSTTALAVADLGYANYAVIEHPTLGTFTAQSVQPVDIRDRLFETS
jgi:hypothetical protein